MKTDYLIIGAGILGLCTAYALSKRGRSVRVLEAREDVALETSFANAAMVHASLADPWNRPGVGKDIIKAFLGMPTPMKLKLSAIPSLGFWGWDFLANSNRKKHEAATKDIYKLGQFSQAIYDDWRGQIKPNDDYTHKGLIKFFRTEEDFAKARQDGNVLKELGMVSEILQPQNVIKYEPALSPIKDKIAGAIYYPQDYKADTREFCFGLKRELEKQRAELITNAKVIKLSSSGTKITGAITSKAKFEDEIVSVCAGPWSRDLLKPVGVNLPIRPIKGYSLHFEKNTLGNALLPKLPVVDDSLHCAISPLHGGLRIAGTAEICGFNPRLDEKVLLPIFNMFSSIYPDIAQGISLKHAKTWCGFRPVTSTGKPIIGKIKSSKVKSGLAVNTGHGHMGWTLAAGSAELLAQILSGEQTEIADNIFRPQS